MPYNSQHYTTFTALLQLWGLPLEVAKPISSRLAYIDNDDQDRLIELIASELQKKQDPPKT